MSKFKLSPIIAALIVFFALTNYQTLAQGTFSRLTGVVQDQNGASVAGATVTLTNEATNITQTAETSGGGVYTFDSINVGAYRVSVERQGFKRFESPGNTVSANQTTTVDVKLETGAVTEVVTVEAAAELVQTSSSGNFGQSVEQRPLEALPIVGARGRNPLNFIEFQPGVVSGANTGGGVHVNGSRDRAFNFTLDGIDINETSAGGSNFTPIRTNPDSISEFQVITGNFTAELGRSSGAQVSLVTRTGTNRFTGTAFEFYQTPDFNANEFENNVNNVPKRQFVQHIFGGSFGGPIVKNKAFFFTNLQLLRASESRLVTRTVYTAQARQGIFRYVVGAQNRPAGVNGATVDGNGNVLGNPNIGTYNIGTRDPLCASQPTNCGLDPTIQRLINLTPLPNNFAVGDGLNIAGYNFAAPNSERQYDFTIRGDYNINDRNTLYVRYSQGEQNTFADPGNAGLRAFPDTPDIVDTFRNPKNVAINYRTTFGSNITNEFIFGTNRFAFTFNNPDPNFESNPPFVFNNGLTAPLNNGAAVNNARSLRTNQFVDNFTVVLGAHTFKTGLNFRLQRQLDQRTSVAGFLTTLGADFNTGVNVVDPTAFGLPTLGATGINAADRAALQGAINNLLGRVGNINRSFVANADGTAYEPAGTSFLFDARYDDYDFYGQDTWKARPNLTFDFGLRVEARPSPRSAGQNPILRPDRPIRIGEPATNNISFVEGKLFDDRINLAPSIGFAWDPFSDGKTSVRANYRLAYDRLNTFVLSSFIFQSSPGVTLGVNNQAFGQGGGRIRNGLPAIAPAAGITPTTLRTPTAFSNTSLTVVDPNLKYPENHQWAASIQRDIGFGLVLEASYIGRRAVHLFGGYDANQVNIFARDPRFNESFFDAFNNLRANQTANSQLINALFTGNPANNAGTTQFRSLFANALTPVSAIQTSNVGGGVAAAAATLSQRVVSATDQRQLIAVNGFSPAFFQPFPQYTGALNVLDSNDVSRYNALEILLKRRFNQDLGFQVSYTLARSKDTRSFDPTFAVANRGNAQSASSTPFDNNNRRLNYARSDFDRQHSLQSYFTYELPFGKGKRFFGDSSKAADLLLGGFQLAGIVILQTGRPFTIFSGVNTFSNVVQSTANCVPQCPRGLGEVRTESGTSFYFTQDDRAAFSVPNPGENGNTGRNYFEGPGRIRFDASLGKRFRFDERRIFELRIDAQNLTNTPEYGLPTTTVTSNTFGRIRDTITSASRRIQIGGKFYF